MLVCGCGRWMHTQGVDECLAGVSDAAWLVRSECLGCGFAVGCEGVEAETLPLVDRLVWSDDARHVLDRMPPYVASLVNQEVEDYVRSHNQRVVTMALMAQARQGGAVAWEPEAEERLVNVPGPVRAMARLELERTAVERGLVQVTVALMEEVKARYFGMAAQKT
ncbi:MAG: PCP reductase family protein [Nitrospiraceae bacterium]